MAKITSGANVMTITQIGETSTEIVKSFVPFSGQGHRLGNGEESHIAKPLIEQFGKSFVDQGAKTLIREFPSMCTRNSECASKTLETFAKGIDDSKDIVIRFTGDAVREKLKYVGPVVTAVLTAPTVYSDLKNGDLEGAVITTGTAAASYSSGLAATAYCTGLMAWTGPAAPVFGFGCGVGTAYYVNTIGEKVKQSRTDVPISQAVGSTTSSNIATISSGGASSGGASSGGGSSGGGSSGRGYSGDGAAGGAAGGAGDDDSEDEYEFDPDTFVDPLELAVQDVLAFAQTIPQGITHLSRTRTILHYIMSHFHRTNPFMPSRIQARLLEDARIVRIIGNIGDLNLDEWLELMGDGSILYEGHTQAVIDDQRERAHNIILQMLNNGQRTLLTMDGHGRFTWMFFTELRAILTRENLMHTFTEYTVQLVDNDPYVTEWHQNFLPDTGVEVIVNQGENIGNIFHMTPGIVPETTLVYLNFCGLGEMVQDVEWYLMQFMSHGRRIFLSYSDRGVGIGTSAGIFRDWVTNNNRPLFGSTIDERLVVQFNSDEVARRTNFVTYMLQTTDIIQLPEEQVQEEQDSDSDDEIIIRPRKRQRRSILDDDDSDED